MEEMNQELPQWKEQYILLTHDIFPKWNIDNGVEEGQMITRWKHAERKSLQFLVYWIIS